MVDEAQKALEEAEALKKVLHLVYINMVLFMKLLESFSL